jgi:hypothetical protein
MNNNNLNDKFRVEINLWKSADFLKRDLTSRVCDLRVILDGPMVGHPSTNLSDEVPWRWRSYCHIQYTCIIINTYNVIQSISYYYYRYY